MAATGGPKPGGGSGGSEGGRWGRLVVRVEEGFFLVVLCAFIVSGLYPMLARYVGFAGAAWPGPLTQQLVLWVALFGAGAATRDRKHITIDAVSQFLPGRARRALRAGTEIIAAAVCALLVPISWKFVSGEMEFSGDAPSPLGVPVGWLPAVLPLGFFLLALRLAVAAWVDAQRALGRHDEDEAG